MKPFRDKVIIYAKISIKLILNILTCKQCQRWPDAYFVVQKEIIQFNFVTDNIINLLHKKLNQI